MDNHNESDQKNDSLAAARTHVGLQAEDPLAAIKNMRLEQLAACHLKSQEALQVMGKQSQDQVQEGDAAEE